MGVVSEQRGQARKAKVRLSYMAKVVGLWDVSQPAGAEAGGCWQRLLCPAQPWQTPFAPLHRLPGTLGRARQGLADICRATAGRSLKRTRATPSMRHRTLSTLRWVNRGTAEAAQQCYECRSLHHRRPRKTTISLVVDPGSARRGPPPAQGAGHWSSPSSGLTRPP